VSLEQIFIDHVGRPADEEEHLAPAAAAAEASDSPAEPGSDATRPPQRRGLPTDEPAA
jgi:hypothetical protein